MTRFNMPTKIAFISSCPQSLCPIATFTSRLVEYMIPTSYGAFEPVMISVQPDISRDRLDAVDFVIRRDFRSDYMEAADFINSGNGDVVVLQHHFDLFGDDAGVSIAQLAKKVDIPIITTIHMVPENAPKSYFQSLVNICDVSHRVLVMNGYHLEVLNKQYGVPLNKIDQVLRVNSDNPFDQQMKWFHVGRHYWQLVSDCLDQSPGRSQIPQAANESHYVHCGLR